jgi:hypothetical protein
MPIDPKRSTAHGFWRYAVGYYHAGEAVREAPGRPLTMPALQLYGQSIELSLKAFLLKRGVPLTAVRTLSHRLEDILSAARLRRLGTQVKLTRMDLDLIALLGVNYALHRFRYMESGPTKVPELEAIAAVAERLVASLEKYCTGMVWGIDRGRG